MLAYATLLLLLGSPTPTARGLAQTAYDSHRQELEQRRCELARRLASAGNAAARAEVLASAREVLTKALRDDIVSAWIGTPWDFYGTSEQPGRGAIACGYFVTTVLRDAGFRLQRASLAQQAAENIIRSLVPAGSIWRFSDPPLSRVLDLVDMRGDGVFVVGLDYHVGLLLRRAGVTEFCHSSVLPPGYVVCAKPKEDLALRSRYYVVGELLNDRTLTAWLEGRAFATLAARK